MIDCEHLHPFLRISWSADWEVTLDGLVIQRAYTGRDPFEGPGRDHHQNSGDGGAIIMQRGVITMINVVIRDSYAVNHGGALCVQAGRLRLARPCTAVPCPASAQPPVPCLFSTRACACYRAQNGEVYMYGLR